MKINLDPDYEAAIGNSGTEFQKFTLHHLRAMFSKIHLDVHDLSLQKGSIQLSFLLKYTDTHDYLYVEDNFTSLFQVPNHLQITMKKKMFYIQTHPTSEDKSRRLFYTLEFLKNQMNIKYPLLSHYINIYVFNKLQNFSSYNNQRAFSLDEEESSFTHEKPKHETRPEFDSNRLEKTSSLGDSNLKKLNSKNIHPKIDEVSEKDMEFEAPLLSSFSTKISKINQKSRIRRNVQTSTKDSNLRLKVRFSFQTPVKSDTNNEEFQKHLKKQLARKMRVPLPSIEAMKIASGTDVQFTLSIFNDENNAMDEETILDAASFIKKEINANNLRLTDLKGQQLMAANAAYISNDDNSVDFSLVILILLGITLFMIIVLILVLIYVGRSIKQVSNNSSYSRNRAYRNMDFGRDSSQSVGKYSYDSGLWLGPGSEPTFMVPDAPYYRPPTVEQITSTPRPITAVRTRLKTNWNVDERALSTIPDDLNRAYVERAGGYR